MIEIKINRSTFKRLESLAVGFDTPDAVINRLIDEVQGRPEKKPTISFNPKVESEFKQKLLDQRIAEVCIHFTDSTKQFFEWNAKKLTATSNLKANLWSGFLRDWKSRGITSISLTVLERPIDSELLRLAHALGLSYEEALVVKPKSHKESDTHYLIWFENKDMSILDKISHKLNNDLNVYLPSYMLEV